MRRYIDILSENSTNGSLLSLLEDHLLLEAKAYEEMMVAPEKLLHLIFPPDNNKEQSNIAKLAIKTLYNTLNRIKDFAKTLRQDRAVWFTRECRLLFMSSLLKEIERGPGWSGANTITPSMPPPVVDDLKEKARKLFQKYVNEYCKTTGTMGDERNGSPSMRSSNLSSEVNDLVTVIKHIQGTPYAKLQNYVFEPQKCYYQVFNEIEGIEEEFKERAAGKLVLEPGDQIILTLPNNYVWVLLNRAACKKEAAAMGHCGNSPSANTSQRILSLRKIEDELDGVQFMRPCLTFILHEDGYIGEMKGRGNEKPAAHYHDQIEALLRLPLIKGLRGGGYLAANNFALSDMDYERRNRLALEKPSLLTLEEQYAHFGMTPSVAEGFHAVFVKRLNDAVSWRAYDSLQSLFQKTNITPEDKEKLFKLYPDLMTPLEYYKKHGMDDYLMKVIQDGVNWCKDFLTREYWWGGGQKSDNKHGRNPWNYSLKGISIPWIEKTDLTLEDRRKLFTKYPDTMDLEDQYEMEGMTDEVMSQINSAIEENGLRWYKTSGINPQKFSEEDRLKLFTKYSRTAPMEWLLKTHGCNEEFVKNVEEEFTGLDVTFREEDNEKWFGFFGWNNVEQLIDDYGDDDFKAYIKDDIYSYDADVDASDLHVENFDDYLPIVARIKLAQIALDYIKDDEDEVENFDPNNWQETLKILQDNNDPNYDAIMTSVMWAYESGTTAQIEKTKTEALKNVQFDFGQLNFKTDGKWIDFDGPVTFDMSPEDVAKFIDEEFDKNASYGLEDFLERTSSIHLDVPRYGFNDFDDSSVLENFYEQDGINSRDLEQNPYTIEKINKMKAPNLIVALKKTYAKIPDGMLYKLDDKQFDGMEEDKLREKLFYIVQKYYGYYPASSQ